MDKLHYKGKGEHSVRELELIIEQQAEELHLLNSGQMQLLQADVITNEMEVCDCEIPKPIDPFDEMDKQVCKDCSGYIEQT